MRRSEALQLGFVNFPMDQFGVRAPTLKAIARTPALPAALVNQPATLQSSRDPRTATWLGATVRNVVGMGEVSAAGLPGETGILVLDAPPLSRATRVGLRRGDVIVKVGGTKTDALPDLLRHAQSDTGEITVFRDQREIVLRF